MAGTPGNPELYKRLDSVITPVIPAEIKNCDLLPIDDSEITPFEQLEAKQQRFIDEYMLDFNNTNAAIRAGYSPRTANSAGARLFANVSIHAHIDRRLAEASRRTGVNADRVVRELARISFASPADAIGLDGSINADASADDKAAIQSIKVKVTEGKNGTTIEREVKFYDKNKSLELLMRHAGMLIERKQIDVHTTVGSMTKEERESEIQRLLAKRNDTIDIDCEIV